MSNCAENPSMVWWSLCSLLFFLSFFFLLCNLMLYFNVIKSDIFGHITVFFPLFYAVLFVYLILSLISSGEILNNLLGLVYLPVPKTNGNKWQFQQKYCNLNMNNYLHDYVWEKFIFFFLNPHNYLTYCLFFFFSFRKLRFYRQDNWVQRV